MPFDEVLCFFQTEACYRANFLDHVDLLVTDSGQDNVKGSFSSPAGTGIYHLQQLQQQLEQQRAPIYLQASWTVQLLQELSGQTGHQRALQDQPFYFTPI